MCAGGMPVIAGDLIEAMRFDPAEGLCLLERHLARLTEAAAASGFAFDRHEARNALQAATFRLEAPACVRLLLARSGAMAIEAGALPPAPAAPLAVTVIEGDMPRVATTASCADAAAARARAGTFEIVFADARGIVSRGSFTDIFVRDGTRLRTPQSGDGVLRADLIDSGQAVAAQLRAADLAAGFLIGNALLGIVPARLA